MPRMRHTLHMPRTIQAATEALLTTKPTDESAFLSIPMRLELDASVYTLEAVQNAAYRFIDRLAVLISLAPNVVVCDIELVPGAAHTIEHILNDFKRELLDQNLRKQIKDETQAARNLILSWAFSNSGLQQ
jgi:His-Xaa-Ser system protein HxsD